MKFRVEQRVFELLEDACFGVVIARGIDNTKQYPRISELLEEGVRMAERRFEGAKVKEDPAITPYRDAFTRLSINPNKFMSSIEAMFTRVSKGKGLPNINPIVDLGNAMSLKYVLPMGAHDIDRMDADMEVRFSRPGDTFLSFGEQDIEEMPADELVYAVGNRVRTRRWIWRQSELGKIDGSSANVFYPIDGFAVNRQAVLSAREELAALCEGLLGLTDVKLALVDRDNPEITL